MNLKLQSAHNKLSLQASVARITIIIYEVIRFRQALVYVRDEGCSVA